MRPCVHSSVHEACWKPLLLFILMQQLGNIRPGMFTPSKCIFFLSVCNMTRISYTLNLRVKPGPQGGYTDVAGVTDDFSFT